MFIETTTAGIIYLTNSAGIICRIAPAATKGFFYVALANGPAELGYTTSVTEAKDLFIRKFGA